MTTDDKSIRYALMSQHAREREDEREERRDTRRTWAEAGAAIALGLIGFTVWAISAGVMYVR
ncbi:hypothetical protein IMZ29_01005 [Achromobacter sp. GG226]|uniref:hypothetical protein n=1 Tax=Verticiella alkaliphila TaxID=2779529 RepID=UPI001C0C960F|nr:hypothetical protein [Verticiella sp. GG226]MBU4609182.1 hypothetical protein [Verticiella sp. GG226]